MRDYHTELVGTADSLSAAADSRGATIVAYVSRDQHGRALPETVRVWLRLEPSAVQHLLHQLKGVDR